MVCVSLRHIGVRVSVFAIRVIMSLPCLSVSDWLRCVVFHLATRLVFQVTVSNGCIRLLTDVTVLNFGALDRLVRQHAGLPFRVGRRVRGWILPFSLVWESRRIPLSGRFSA